MIKRNESKNFKKFKNLLKNYMLLSSSIDLSSAVSYIIFNGC